ncbi:MAG: TetR/AcrR family transcriptional regulator, partial [Croceibacterium sp.]
IVCDSIAEAVLATRAGIGNPREVVDLTFDAFDREGGGALASWMILSGNEDALDPIVEAIDEVVNELHPQEGEPGAQRTMHEATLALVLMALGDALIGERLAQSMRVGRDTARERATAMLTGTMLQVGDLRG